MLTCLATKDSRPFVVLIDFPKGKSYVLLQTSHHVVPLRRPEHALLSGRIRRLDRDRVDMLSAYRRLVAIHVAVVALALGKGCLRTRRSYEISDCYRSYGLLCMCCRFGCLISCEAVLTH